MVAANNLSDLASVPTARTNLGLGTDNLPTILPTLNLDFANIPDLDSRLTYTRASTATYYDAFGVLQTAAVDTPRLDYDPSTGESLGILLEEQRTNLLTYSEQFDNAAWGKTNVSVTPNAIAAPDGTTSADLVYELTGSGGKAITINLTASSSTDYTSSVYAKAGTRSVLGLRADGAGVESSGSISYFDLSSGTVQISAGHTSATIEDAGGGWYRCSITESSSVAGGDYQLRIHICQSVGTQIYTGDGTSGIYLWGAQLEAGSFATSYIKTEASQVTWSADDLSITGTNFSDFYN